MALRSQEEISLATVFARTLRNVIALTSAEEQRAWPRPREVLEHTPRDARRPRPLLRLLQFSILPEILGESAGPAMYLAGKRFSRELEHPLHPGAQGLVPRTCSSASSRSSSTRSACWSSSGTA